MGGSRTHGPCDRNQVWRTGWRRLRAHTDAELSEAVQEANELHATGALFARQIEPESAPADPVDWAMAEASDDEDDALTPDAPLEPELIDLPPAPASAAWSCASHCAWYVVLALTPPKKCHLHHISASLSVVSRVGCPVCPGLHPCFHVLTTRPRHPDSDKPCFFFLLWPQQSVDTR